MTEDESLRRFGLNPADEQLAEIRCILEGETAKEADIQGNGDTELMKLCCVQLFNAGHAEDIVRIWRAKQASFDAACSIEVELLCGPGLPQTLASLRAESDKEATAVLDAVEQHIATGDFDEFSPEAWSANYDAYYASEE